MHNVSRNGRGFTVIEQEAYLADNQGYTGVADLSVTTSTGVSLGGGGSAGGYSMTAQHSASPETWTVVVGSGSSTDGRIQ